MMIAYDAYDASKAPTENTLLHDTDNWNKRSRYRGGSWMQNRTRSGKITPIGAIFELNLIELNPHISWSQRSSPWSHKCSGAQGKTAQINIVHTTTKNTLRLNTRTLVSIRLSEWLPVSNARNSKQRAKEAKKKNDVEPVHVKYAREC